MFVYLQYVFILSSVTFGYDFRTTSEGGFYSAIMQVNSTEQIGQRFQTPVTDPDGNPIGINQGYSFLFPDHTNASQPWVGTRIFFLQGGVLNVVNTDIISATGDYVEYSGGTFEEVITSTDPHYVADITLVRPVMGGDVVPANTQELPTTFITTSEGGFYSAIMQMQANSTEQIGQRFQTPVSDSDGNPIGINQGYSFLFPNDTYATQPWVGTRIFFLEGGVLNVVNTDIISATGDYVEYAGGSFKEVITSTDPHYVANITLVKPELQDESRLIAPTTLTITRAGGFYSAIMQVNSTDQIGEQFINPVIEGDTNRIGTNQGYAFMFPNHTEATQPWVGTRILYLEGGVLDVVNTYIMSATGDYAEYAGGSYEEEIISFGPDFVTKITLTAATNNTITTSPPTSGAFSGFVQWSVAAVLVAFTTL